MFYTLCSIMRCDRTRYSDIGHPPGPVPLQRNDDHSISCEHSARLERGKEETDCSRWGRVAVLIITPGRRRPVISPTDRRVGVEKEQFDVEPGSVHDRANGPARPTAALAHDPIAPGQPLA